MADRELDWDTTPNEGEATPSFPDEVWQKFLNDSEHVIRASAPEEPSALQRTTPEHRAPLGADAHCRPGQCRNLIRPADSGSEQHLQDAVGELWQSEAPAPGPAWKDMDGRARRRRVARALVTVAAILALLKTASYLPTGSDNPSGGSADATSQQSENTPDDPSTATAFPPGPASADTPPPVSRVG
ncbi:hypothetical protein OHB05_29400 [Streptomyces sp. NBC_00638]|uniref:hypothetical protein n=1 Tax=Streptomyces sp. NBC_00638 TaxID=2975794 RepID=UPI00225BCFBF|nr:hypothetical protein [Streptomyces sp. NBC_00638]MCX5006706.1 hypothetical protein [Streptomyces sp. NBC_00638]